MKKIIITLIALLAIVGGIFTFLSNKKTASSNGEIQQGELIVGLEGTYKPFSYRDGNKLTGFEVELAQDVAKKLGLKASFVQTKWDSLIAGINANKYDVVFNNVGTTEERKQGYDFSTPYFYSKTLLIKKNNNTSINSLADIKGKKFAQSTSSNFGKLAKDNGAEIVSVPGFVEAINLINTDRADGTLNDYVAFNDYVKSNPNANITSIDISNQVESIPSAPILKKNSKLTAKISQAIDGLKSDGTLKNLSEKYFGSDLTNSN